MREKGELRREMRARRKELAADAKSAADAAICEKLKARSDISGPVAVYLASTDEVNIDPCIEHMLRAGVDVVAPRWNGEAYELARLKGLDEKKLRRGPMGIREPVDADAVDPKKVQAWIVPGLAFTREGKRLGYGGGWYDRFLASAPKGAVKIGVAYSFMVVGDLPCEPHDISLTDVIDDSRDEPSRLPGVQLPLRRRQAARLPRQGDRDCEHLHDELSRGNDEGLELSHVPPGEH